MHVAAAYYMAVLDVVGEELDAGGVARRLALIVKLRVQTLGEQCHRHAAFAFTCFAQQVEIVVLGELGHRVHAHDAWVQPIQVCRRRPGAHTVKYDGRLRIDLCQIFDPFSGDELVTVIGESGLADQIVGGEYSRCTGLCRRGLYRLLTDAVMPVVERGDDVPELLFGGVHDGIAMRGAVSAHNRLPTLTGKSS